MTDVLISIKAQAAQAIQEQNRWRRVLGLSISEVSKLTVAMDKQNDKAVKSLRAVADLAGAKLKSTKDSKAFAAAILEEVAATSTGNKALDAANIRLRRNAQQILDSTGAKLALARETRALAASEGAAARTTRETIAAIRDKAKATAAALLGIETQIRAIDRLRAKETQSALRKTIGLGKTPTGDAANFSETQTTSAQAALASLRLVQEQSGTTKARVIALYQAMIDGANISAKQNEGPLIQSLRSVVGVVQQSRVAVVRAEEAKQKAYEKTLRLATLAAQKRFEQTQAESRIRTFTTVARQQSFAPSAAKSAGGTVGEVTNLVAAQERLAKAAAKAKLSIAGLRQEFVLFAGGAGGGTPAVQLQIQNLLNKTQQVGAVERANAEARRQQAADQNRLTQQATAQMQNQVNLRRQLSQLDKATGFLAPKGGAAASQPELLNVQNAKARLAELLSAGKLTFSDLLQAIRRLKTGSDQAFAGLSGTARAALRGLITAYGKMGAEATNAQEQARKAAERTSKELLRQKGNVQQVLISWQSLGRLLLVQIIHGTLGRITGLISESNAAFAEFEIKISQIRTIAQDNQLTFKQWATSVGDLASRFGATGIDVATAAYNALSNQVAKGTQVFTFLEEAMRFGAITVATTEQSVNLLASAINSYGLSVGATEELSAQFFKSMDLGRFVASELDNTFGRVAASSNQVGISMAELLGSMSLITIQGIKANEAMTLINNVVLKLIRPSEEMQKVFDGMGVASGRAAIETFGLQGVLQQLLDITDGGKLEEIGELFQRARAVRGGSILIEGIRTGKLQETIEEIQTAGESSAKAFEIAFESTGKKLEIQFATLRESIRENFSTPLGEAALSFFQLFGDKNKGLVNLVSLVSKGLVGLAIGLTLVGVKTRVLAAFGGLAFKRMAVEVRKTGVELTYLGFVGAKTFAILKASAGSFALLALGFVIERMITARLEAQALRSAWTEISDEINHAKQQLEEKEAAVRSLRGQVESGLAKAFQEVNQVLAAARLQFSKLSEELEKMADNSEATFRKLASDISDGVRDNLNSIREILREAERSIDKVTDRLADLPREFERIDFEIRLDLLQDPQNSFDFVQKRLDKLKEETTKVLSEQDRLVEAGIPFDPAEAETVQRRLTTLAEQSDSILKERLDLLKQQIKLMDAIRNDEEQTDAIRKTAGDRLKTLLDSVKDLGSVEAELRERELIRLKKIQESQKNKEAVQGGAERKVAVILAEINKIDVIKDTDALKLLFDAIAKFTPTVDGQKQDLLALAGVSLDYRLALEAELALKEKLIKQAEEQRKGLEALETVQKKIDEARRAEKAALFDFDENTQAFKDVTVGKKAELEKKLTTLFSVLKGTQLARGVKDTEFPAKDAEGVPFTAKAGENGTFGQIAERIDVLLENFNKGKSTPEELTRLLSELTLAQATLNSAIAVQIASDRQAGNTKRLQVPEGFKQEGNDIVPVDKPQFGEKGASVKDLINDIKLQVQAAIDAKTAIEFARKQQARSILRLEELEKESRGLVEKFDSEITLIAKGNMQRERMIIALEDLVKRVDAMLNKGAIPHGPGFASGGFVNGSDRGDRIAARLTSGEFVVNRKSVSRNLGLLEAINNGEHLKGSLRPSFEVGTARGTTGTTVGDINVTVNGGDTSPQTVDAIASELRRQLRRGTISLTPRNMV